MKEFHGTSVQLQNLNFVQMLQRNHFHICLTSVTHVKCGVRSTLCWKVGNISGST